MEERGGGRGGEEEEEGEWGGTACSHHSGGEWGWLGQQSLSPPEPGRAQWLRLLGDSPAQELGLE